MNIATLLEDHPGSRTAIVSGSDRVSYGQLREEIAAIRGVLTGLGLEPGDRVAILCGTNTRFVHAWYGAVGAGMVAVPLNPQAPAAEIQRELSVVHARAVIAGPAGVAALESLDRSEVPSLEHCLVPTGAVLEGAIDLDAAVAQAADAPPAVAQDAVTQKAGVPIVDRDDEQLATLLFTSGTAGSPKAAMLTHGNLASNIRQVLARPEQVARPDDVTVCVVPLFHVLGLNSILNLSLWVGATLVLVERFDPVSMVGLIVEEQVSTLAGPPTMWSALTHLEDVEEGAFSRIRLAASGAAAIPDRVVEQAQARFGVRIYEGYGLTEASPTVTLATGTDAPIGSIGRPIPGVEVRLVDKGDDVYVGDPGEVLVRGPNVFRGYLGDPVATARVIDEEGWLHTGDIAVVDDDGYLYLVDRAKDLVIVSGFNVFPAEVERVLVTHPAVREAGVVGIPHPYSGETVKAFVVAEDGYMVEEDDLVAWCANELARYKCPTKIDFVDEIPRGMGGKVLRRELR
ncbi:MAG: long-chain fatty acid--CoA ligase [Acidimicrobiaceae bacterium]|nr:AMP-binding protein [Acidimicrobiaceae bacterium]MXW60247.1 long-chain fatty acid--CoA ligase [Acidimicrobiaceae bacterium]MXW76204.1 long-chain fatty acid--CoA ligase [Acidimicrobiaceae bacterium]MYA74982.1 long-chain fatty acid--CoA ligase [Acidimicrobiaceae bacterium]MYC42667.1 long-chain fatty acid--CoA ligase [Acidimicrobiaceae bacterium]